MFQHKMMRLFNKCIIFIIASIPQVILKINLMCILNYIQEMPMIIFKLFDKIRHN